MIDVSSKPGEGTTFEVYIPAYEPQKEKKQISPDKIILLADDEEMLSDLLAELLESNDYNVIKVSSGKEEDKKDSQRNYLHRGIAQRNFKRQFKLADHIKVTGATMENGLLHIALVREIPEAMKPRQIEINGSGNRLLKSA